MILRNVLKTACLFAFAMYHLKTDGQIAVHSFPDEVSPEKSELFQVFVKQKGTDEWMNIQTLACRVNARNVQKAAFAEFDMAQPVTVKIVSNDSQQLNDIKIRPSRMNIPIRILDNNSFLFDICQPGFFSVEINHDRHHNLHLFANPIASETHSPDEPNTMNWQGEQAKDVFIRNPKLIYFGPGLHRPKDLPGGDIKIPSNCTVYIAPGAVVRARLIVDHAENVRIIGRGVILNPLRGVEITFSKNVLVEGITVINPDHYTIFGGESENIVIRGVKAFSAKSWTDGVDLMCCKNVTVDRCFFRTSDDCVALYNHRWWFWGGSENIRVDNCVLWPDIAHPVNIGSHGDDRNPQGETLKDVVVENCDILYNNHEGLLAINCGDNNHIENISFSDIWAEGIEKGCLFDMKVLMSEKYNRAPGWNISDVSFRNISVDEQSALRMTPSIIEDYDSIRIVGTWSYDNVLLGNKQFNAQNDVNIKR